MNILLLSGSFHSRSKSNLILAGLMNYFPENQYAFPKLDYLPFFSEDLNVDKPEVVAEFLQQVAACDGIVICSPEYNHSIPAVLKNALDWASRPAFKSGLKDKPVTIITQANSAVGGARAQAHIKLVLDSTLSLIYPAHEMMIPYIDKVIDESGSIVDLDVERRLKRHFVGFVEFMAGNS